MAPRPAGRGSKLPDGTLAEPGGTLLGSLVGHTMLECEAGHWVGRVVGLLVAPPDHGELPF